MSETAVNNALEKRFNAPNTFTTVTARGRSKSRRPASRNTSASPHIRNARFQPDHNSSLSSLIPNPIQTQSAKAPSSSHPPTPNNLANTADANLPPTISSPSLKPHIPNLNTPTEESSTSISITLPNCPPSHLANPTSPNKFGVLQTVEEEQELSAGSSSKDLETETSSSQGELSAPPSTRSQNQKTAKGKQAKKNPHHHNSSQPFLLSVIYASNDRGSRSCLWDQIRSSVPSQDTPWIIMGDFNCCRFASDKLGGNVISQSSMGEFNSMIFDTRLTDMHSIGNKYTWFNQRQDCPIHIKLDRVLVNDSWLHTFPNTYYSVQAPSCSDHCPLILQNTDISHANHRFMFKNYWTSLDCFWHIVLDVFSISSVGNPISDFCGKLKLLKSRIKREPWANSNAIQDHLDDLYSKQSAYLGLLSTEPDNPSLNSLLKYINKQILDSSHLLSSWIIQRAKASWLSQGEDNLKFLYAKIKRRMALRNSALNLSTSSSPLRADAVNDIIQHYQNQLNPDVITYLGIPIAFKKLKISDFHPLMDTITKKLSGWNANLLSYAGRLQYLKFTMINSIAYWIRGSILPKYVTKFLRKIASKFFLFGDSSVGRKLHMVAWDNVCMPKCKGGLGLFSLPALAYGFNCSLILRLSNYTYPLADWFSVKYGTPWLPPTSNASPFWKAICCTAQAANNNFTFHMTNASGRCVKWKNMEKHRFRDFMEDYYSHLPDCFWANFVWHKKSALRFSVFAWLALRGGLKTAVELNRRNIHVDLDCFLCHNNHESSSHLFFECNFSHDILINIIPASSSLLLRPTINQFFEWINDCPNFSTQTKRLYFLSTCCIIYYVWRERNERSSVGGWFFGSADDPMQVLYVFHLLRFLLWFCCCPDVCSVGAYFLFFLPDGYPLLWIIVFILSLWTSERTPLGGDKMQRVRSHNPEGQNDHRPLRSSRAEPMRRQVTLYIRLTMEGIGLRLHTSIGKNMYNLITATRFIPSDTSARMGLFNVG
ncbi:hypothetical protein M5K25_001594 [Dendrobium thyrsiflorum]|uniref:Reverse transcriptase zinc-binding domain-containing protein n=1 Tax=Dendrobium thyrsiflorum TaxID=117978 RepID=A0ABD0W1I0_DENTH